MAIINSIFRFLYYIQIQFLFKKQNDEAVLKSSVSTMPISSDQSSSLDISTQLEAAEQCTFESDTSAVPKNSLAEHGEYIET